MRLLSDIVFKWSMHITVIAGDCILLGSTIFILIIAWITHNLFLWLIVIFLLYQCWVGWKEQGGIIAWTKKGRKEFEDGYDYIKSQSHKRMD